MFAHSEPSRNANFRGSLPDSELALADHAGMATTLHIHLRAHRKRARMSLEQVAAALGTVKSVMSEKERGLKPVTLDDLERLAVIYGTSPLALLLAPEDGPRAEAMRQAAEIARTRDDEATRNWLAMGRHLPKGNATD